MSRPLRLEFPGSFWHITSRGNARQDIVRDEADRQHFLKLLGDAVDRFQWIVYAYALMTNHFHLVIELTEETLSTGLHWLKGTYAQFFNQRHERVGHVFQGRFGAILVDRESYFFEVIRYVVLNPVRAGMVERPEDGEWTSFPATIGHCDPPPWLAVSRVLASFGGDTQLARERFRAFVYEGIGVKAPWSDLQGQIYLGSESWIEQTKARVEENLRSDEHPRVQRELMPIRMRDVITATAEATGITHSCLRTGRGGSERMIAAWIGCNEAHLTLREVAAALQIRSAGHASELISACDRRLDVDESLRETVDRCLQLLREWRNRKPKA